MEKPDSELEGLYHEMAARFGALGQLFSQLSSPKAAKELFKSSLRKTGLHSTRSSRVLMSPSSGNASG